MPLYASPGGAAAPWLTRELRSDECGLCLIHLLLNCAAAAGAGRLDAANAALEHNADATQWLELLHLLAARPEGPLHLRLTAVHEHWDVLTQTAMALTKEAERLDVPFQFNPVVSRLEALDAESLRVKTGEALAVTSSVQLHCLLASDDDSSGKDGCHHHHQSSNGKGGDTNKRHERLDRWAVRMEGAGFARVLLSYYALLQARRAARGARRRGSAAMASRCLRAPAVVVALAARTRSRAAAVRTRTWARSV
ncbi:unnamed protein product [Miscanthus lutarioriparius]|uniref:Uncharacterized protein n=1 Tax=Miscanthus lutarioriparius TaxID=422564 RepID=A0A811QV99_9POAL|nr:unnamed protein product [Miscanthus lutarioriparius]